MPGTIVRVCKALYCGAKNGTIQALDIPKFSTWTLSAPVNNTPPSDSPPDNTTEGDGTEAQPKDIPAHVAQDATAPGKDLPDEKPTEHGGQQGLEPTRYGDWEKKGRCTDF